MPANRCRHLGLAKDLREILVKGLHEISVVLQATSRGCQAECTQID